jgi:hypothetical protein
MEAVSTSEKSVYTNETTRRYIPEGSNLHPRRRENLKYHMTLNNFRSITKCCLQHSDKHVLSLYFLTIIH